jgi:hypothetical protein
MMRYLYTTKITKLDDTQEDWNPVVAFDASDAVKFIWSEHNDMEGEPTIKGAEAMQGAQIPETVPIIPLDDGRAKACYANARVLDFVEGKGDGQIKTEDS